MFQKKSEAKGVQEQLMTNPDMMQNMMKQQLTGLVPQVIQKHAEICSCLSKICAFMQNAC